MTPSDLVWIQTGFLGDVVLTTAAIALGRAEFPAAKHHLITTPVGKEALGGWPGLDSLTVWDKRKEGGLGGIMAVKRRVMRELAHSAPVVLKPHRSIRSALLARALDWPVVTHCEASLSLLAWQRVPRVATFHEAHRIALLLEPLGVSREAMLAARPCLTAVAMPDEEWSRAVNALTQRRIGVAPGSVWGTKRWTPAGYRSVVQRLLEHGETSVVMLGGREEAVLVQEIIAPLKGHPRLVDCAGKTKIRELRWLVPQLSALVANDSALVHFATAFNVPTVAIFGATVPEMGFAPLANSSSSMGVAGLPCRPCGAHGPMKCPLGHFRCMRDLAADAVLARIHLVP